MERAAQSEVRRRLAVALAVVTPLGFATKAWPGPGAAFVRFYAGGILYVVFWIFVVQAVRPSLPPHRVALGVLAATSVLEVLQLWHPPFLEAVRGTFLGRALIGSTFSAWDFPCYLLGAAAGWWLVRRLASAR